MSTIIYALLILFSLVVFSAVFYYGWRMPRLWEEIVDEIDQHYWPQRWLLLAFIPVFGRRWFSQVKKRAEEWPNLEPLDLEGDLEGERIKVTDIRKSDWILFGEQHKTASGDHYGTIYHALDHQMVYKFYPTSQIPSHKQGQIPVKVPRFSSRGEVVWAHLRFRDDDHWMLENVSGGCIVIPVYHYQKIDQIAEYSMQSLSSQKNREGLLESGDRFVIGFSEFQIVRLPRIALFRKDMDRSHFLMLPVERMTYIGYEGTGVCHIPKEPQILGRHITIYKDQLYFAQSDVTICYFNTGQPEEPKNGSIKHPLSPGDRFTTGSNPQYDFFVDYI